MKNRRKIYEKIKRSLIVLFLVLVSALLIPGIVAANPTDSDTSEGDGVDHQYETIKESWFDHLVTAHVIEIWDTYDNV